MPVVTQDPKLLACIRHTSITVNMLSSIMCSLFQVVIIVYKHSNHVMNIAEKVRSVTQSIKHYTAMNFTCWFQTWLKVSPPVFRGEITVNMLSSIMCSLLQVVIQRRWNSRNMRQVFTSHPLDYLYLIYPFWLVVPQHQRNYVTFPFLDKWLVISCT
jgi:hypothetical protein